jgi:hypothetical protein
MKQDWERRDFLSLMGIGGVVFASGLVACGGAASAAAPTLGRSQAKRRLAGEDFFFLQLSDTHWGFKGPPNPQADVTLEHAVATINAVDVQPDFIVFTGDLTHTTDDAAERRTRMARFKEIVSALKVKDVRFIPGDLSQRDNVTVFYGHIHQEHHQMTGKIAHHSARSLVFPLPAPGSVPKKAPLPWDPASSDHGLGWRSIAMNEGRTQLTEVPFR